MVQQAMSWHTFTQIVDSIDAPSVVSLQGEGEPVLHKRFWDMVQYLTDRGHTPYVITNLGYTVTPQMARRFHQHFPMIGVSVDTTDPTYAEQIGRHDVDRTLRNIRTLSQAMSPSRLTLYTVDLGKQYVSQVRDFARSVAISRHVVQPLQPKDDYARRYRHLIPVVDVSPQPKKLMCRYLNEVNMRYFTVDAVELPCCFIRDANTFVSRSHIKSQLAVGAVPTSCAGCRQIVPA